MKIFNPNAATASNSYPLKCAMTAAMSQSANSAALLDKPPAYGAFTLRRADLSGPIVVCKTAENSP